MLLFNVNSDYVFYILIEFSLGPAGNLCTDVSLQSINNVEACRKSFQAVKKLYPEAIEEVSYNHPWHEKWTSGY